MLLISSLPPIKINKTTDSYSFRWLRTTGKIRLACVWRFEIRIRWQRYNRYIEWNCVNRNSRLCCSSVFDRRSNSGTYVPYGTKPLRLMNSKTPVWLPPWQLPAVPVAQFKMYWILRLISSPVALRAILMRSPNEERAPCAQQLPQYCTIIGNRARTTNS